MRHLVLRCILLTLISLLESTTAERAADLSKLHAEMSAEDVEKERHEERVRDREARRALAQAENELYKAEEGIEDGVQVQDEVDEDDEDDEEWEEMKRDVMEQLDDTGLLDRWASEVRFAPFSNRFCIWIWWERLLGRDPLPNARLEESNNQSFARVRVSWPVDLFMYSVHLVQHSHSDSSSACKDAQPGTGFGRLGLVYFESYLLVPFTTIRKVDFKPLDKRLKWGKGDSEGGKGDSERRLRACKNRTQLATPRSQGFSSRNPRQSRVRFSCVLHYDRHQSVNS